MTTLAATADAAFLMSIVKPIVFLGVVGAWGWAWSKCDKDAEFFYLKRRLINVGLLLVGVAGLSAMLLIPYFILGVLAGVLLLAGSLVGYAFYRNTKVPKDQLWSLSLDSFQKKAANYRKSQQQKAANTRFKTPKGQVLEVPVGEDPDVAPHKAVADALDFAFPRGAEAVEIVIEGNAAQFVAKVDGIRYAQPAPDPQLAILIVDYIKKISGLDLEDRRRKQTGKIVAASEEHGDHTLGITTSGSTRALSLTLDIDPEQRSTLPISMLGMLPNQLAYLQKLLKENKGAVLLGGDRHQGVPTTRYAMLQDIDPYTNSVVTFEEQIQTELEGVEHHRIDVGMPANEFNQKLGTIIRADPNVLMLSRIADADSCKLLAKSAHEMRFIVPMPQGDTTSALKTWVKSVGDPKLAADALVCVIAQRLVRRLCTTCRIPYTPEPSAVKKLNLPPDKVGTLYRASGRVMVKDKEEPCPDCRGLAYRGRVGVFEVMPLDDTARTFIAKQQWDQLQTYMRKQGMIYLQEAALAKVVEGITDIKEVQRALKKDE